MWTLIGAGGLPAPTVGQWGRRSSFNVHISAVSIEAATIWPLSLLIAVPQSFLHFPLLHLLKELERFCELFLQLIGQLAQGVYFLAR